MTDDDYMNRAIRLAQRGIGKVNPNPLVGAVLVKEGKIIGEGWHEKYGGLHAERNALNNTITNPCGATMYVTLEPCCHHGKTPPCTTAIIQSKISKVVVGVSDPNPLMAGKGIQILRSAGIEVVEQVQREICEQLNEIFFYYIKERKPFLVMKFAMTMDGKIATKAGFSKWITSEMAREQVHFDRNKYTAIMVGVDTVIADNPNLTCNIKGKRNPVRIICDTNLRTPLHSFLVRSAVDTKTIIATSCEDKTIQDNYKQYGCELIILPRKEKHVDLDTLMIELGKREIDSILLEGGSTLNYFSLQQGIVNKVQAYIAPKIFGGANAKTPVGGIGVEQVEKAFRLKNSKVSVFGEDILIESEVDKRCLQEL
jgi:diaminohydroxyphosphoribosylaminopyrimidine deaminase / 5-amino-6-(5-phosphoribosylamino)uracil reductase